MESFNLLKFSGRKKIKDRGINWQEHYKEKSEKLKEKFDKQIGEGAYRRWEGHDYTTNSNYYVVVGPTIQRELGKCFFAGIKKIPNDPKKKVYSPYGKYFINIISAYSYASDKWGIPFPKNQINYNKDVLFDINIAEHIKG
jgi:hypothetical protein